jgi:hypothetical protein
MNGEQQQTGLIPVDYTVNVELSATTQAILLFLGIAIAAGALVNAFKK